MADLLENTEYPAHWEADVVLRDGSTAHLRPIGPADAEALQRFHSLQSESSIYLRFFTYKSKLTDRELERFTRVDHADRVALVVLRGGNIIGVGRYDRLDDPAEAEVAFNIADSLQGHGVGSILLEHLAAAARENGIERFSAEVLPENRKMLTVFAEAGYEVKRRFDDGVVVLEFPIDPTERSRAVMESREHRAEARSLAELLAPESVAVVGAGRDPDGVGHRILRHLVAGGFTGPVHCVNREASEVAGLAAHASIADVPGDVELAVVAVPEAELEGVVAACGAKGVKGLLVATALAGDDVAARQRRLVLQARSLGMRVIGPASLGLVNTDPAVSLNASLSPVPPGRGGLGLFSQSGAIGAMLTATALRRGVGVSSVVSAGNRADVSGNDAMQYWEDDPATSAVGLYLESFGNPRKFSRIARRLSRTKPVIVAKSEAMGLRLPPGHSVRTTLAPLGAVDAMLRQSGVIRVTTNEALLDVAQIVATQPLPSGNGLAVVSNSPAIAAVIADNAEAGGLEVSVVDDTVPADGPPGEVAVRAAAALEAALARDGAHSAVVALLQPRDARPTGLAAALRDAAERVGKPVVVSFPGIVEAHPDEEGVIAADGFDGGRQRAVPAFPSPGRAVQALSAVVRYAAWRGRDFGHVPDVAGLDRDRAEDLVEAHLRRVQGTDLLRLGPADAAELLACYGIRVLESVPFATADEAAAAADRLGWPVALKATDENLRHRLDLGGVRLNIYDEVSLRGNIEHMRQMLRPYGADDLEIQAMAPSGQGCLVRALEDPLLGPLVSFGLAGDAVNLLDDWGHAIPPLTTTDLAELVRSPRTSRKLFGYQGLPAVDVRSLEDLLHRVATLKDDHPGVALVELNPVLAAVDGATVLSADVRLGNARQRTDSARRALSR